MRLGHRSTGTPIRGGTLDWDRVGKVSLIVILLIVGYLYIGPTRSYLTQRKEAAAQRAELQRVNHEHATLKGRSKALQRDSVIELEARRLGMVRAGERPFVIIER